MYPTVEFITKFGYRKKSIYTGCYAFLLCRVTVYRQNSSLPFDQAIYTNSGSSQQEIRNFRQRRARRRCGVDSGSRLEGITKQRHRINFHNERFHQCYALWQSSSQAPAFWDIDWPPLEPLLSVLFLLQPTGDPSFESFSARRIASFRRIFYKLGHFAKPSCCAGALARMPRITVLYITNAQQVERKDRKEGERYRLHVQALLKLLDGREGAKPRFNLSQLPPPCFSFSFSLSLPPGERIRRACCCIDENF